ncbi:MAG: nitroreductase family protein [Chloroflexi bacterium]|nr:nitroreductase family protein [Chloroflexota bacterium]
MDLETVATDRGEAYVAQMNRLVSSAEYLAENMGKAPVMILPCIRGWVETAGQMAQASRFGSILPAAWSLMLALRARGLGAAWTTLHLRYSDEVAAILGNPADITQAALLLVAYSTGADFKPARRVPASEITWWESWGERG